jgi:hypothetical protein
MWGEIPTACKFRPGGMVYEARTSCCGAPAGIRKTRFISWSQRTCLSTGFFAKWSPIWVRSLSSPAPRL